MRLSKVMGYILVQFIGLVISIFGMVIAHNVSISLLWITGIAMAIGGLLLVCYGFEGFRYETIDDKY